MIDGIDHINIYSKGKTDLGRNLSNWSKHPFVHPEDGKFTSVEGYWYWLSSKNDNLRGLWGYKAKEQGRAVGGSDWNDSEEFKRKIRLAIKSKIDQHPIIAEGLTVSVLPFRHYYQYGNRVVEPKEGKWIVDFIEDYRKKLRLTYLH